MTRRPISYSASPITHRFYTGGVYTISLRSVSSYKAPVSLLHTRGWMEGSGFVILPTRYIEARWHFLLFMSYLSVCLSFIFPSLVSLVSDPEFCEVAFLSQQAIPGKREEGRDKRKLQSNLDNISPACAIRWSPTIGLDGDKAALESVIGSTKQIIHLLRGMIRK